MTKPPEVPGAQVLVRALDLLLVLRELGGAASVGELAGRLQLPQSNLYRLLKALEGAGLVDRDTPGRVQLGLGLLELGDLVRHRLDSDFAVRTQPVLRSLTAELRQTSLLTMRAGLAAVCVSSVESPQPIRLSFAPGRLVPLFGGASGRILLPWSSERVLQQVLAQHHSWQLASGVRPTIEQFTQSLTTARRRGYIVTRSEVDPGITGVAAPVLRPNGRIWAGLSVAGPQDQFSRSRIPRMIETVKEHARLMADVMPFDAGKRRGA